MSTKSKKNMLSALNLVVRFALFLSLFALSNEMMNSTSEISQALVSIGFNHLMINILIGTQLLLGVCFVFGTFIPYVSFATAVLTFAMGMVHLVSGFMIEMWLVDLALFAMATFTFAYKLSK